MRGKDTQQSAMFSYVSPERRVPADHPLRPIRGMVDVALKGLSRSFGQMYPDWGRPSIAPEKLLRALLLQLLYSIRSERLLMEQLEYNLLFRWFVGLNMDEPVWVPTVFSKNRDRLLEGEIAAKFFAQVLDQARANDLLSDEHFSVDGTLIEAWASHKSFQRKDHNQAPPPDDPGNPTVSFHGEKRSNDTHQSTTDPEAYSWMVKQPLLRERVYVLGTGARAQRLVSGLRGRPALGIEVGDLTGEVEGELTRDSVASHLLGLAREKDVHRVIVAMPERRGTLPVEELLDLRLGGVKVEEATSWLERINGRIEVEELNPSWLIFAEGFRFSSFFRMVRRVLNFSVALIAGVLSLPLLPFIALAVKLGAPGTRSLSSEAGGPRGSDVLLP